MYVSNPGVEGMMQFSSYYPIPQMDMNSTNMPSMVMNSPPPPAGNGNGNGNNGLMERSTELSMNGVDAAMSNPAGLSTQPSSTTVQYIPHVDPATGMIFYVPMSVPMNEEMMGMMMMVPSFSTPNQQQSQQSQQQPLSFSSSLPEKEDGSR